METLHWINRAVGVLFLVCYAYQFFYIPVAWRPRRAESGPVRLHTFAVLICARNESAVIADLIDSIRQQTYDRGRIDLFVLADNCTDDTAEVARRAGARVYTRCDSAHVGKGYALQALLGHLHRDYPAGFDGYLVFDADNILAPDYVEQMNRTFSQGYDIVTGYRNSKNYGDNWISAGYALWFLRESRYLNYARHQLGTSAAVSGTGFLFSRAVAEEMGDWPFHLLTEDIEFTADQITRGRRIGFCDAAVLYDEQPTTFTQSWHQRMRWARGYLQVLRRYGGRLAEGSLRGSFACFDMAMAITPAFVLSLLSLGTTVTMAVWGIADGGSASRALLDLGASLGGMYLTLLCIGVVTTASEWRQIHTDPARKIFYTLTFPLFMFTYLPISVAALFCRAEWKPIVHSVSAAELRRRGQMPVHHPMNPSLRYDEMERRPSA